VSYISALQIILKLIIVSFLASIFAAALCQWVIKRIDGNADGDEEDES
jgi:hypothetical protein